MRRRVFLAALAGWMAGAGMAEARDRSDDIVRGLKRNGYRITEIGRTFLGRIRILATKDGGRREIIVNPVTGEILRDLWIARGLGEDDWDDWDGNGKRNGRDDRSDRSDDDDGDDDRDDRDDDDRDGRSGGGDRGDDDD